MTEQLSTHALHGDRVYCVCLCVCVCVCARTLSRVWLCDSVDCSPPGFPIHGILQASILEWVAISSSRGSSRPRDWTCISCLAHIDRWVLTTVLPGKPVYCILGSICWKQCPLWSSFLPLEETEVFHSSTSFSRWALALYVEISFTSLGGRHDPDPRASLRPWLAVTQDSRTADH